MADAELEKVLPVNKDRLFDVICKYEDYPQFVQGVTGVEVDRKSETTAEVRYALKVVKDFKYVLTITEDREAGKISWVLKESDFFKKNTGSWTLEAQGEGATHVRYKLEVEFKVPVPGFMLKKLVKGSLPSMVESFERRAK